MYLSQWLFKGTITWLITKYPKDIIFISQPSTKSMMPKIFSFCTKYFLNSCFWKSLITNASFSGRVQRGGVYSCTVEHLDRLFSLHPSMIIQMATTTMILLKVVNSMVGVNDEILAVYRKNIGFTPFCVDKWKNLFVWNE